MAAWEVSGWVPGGQVISQARCNADAAYTLLQAQQQKILHALHGHLVNLASLLGLQRNIVATRSRRPARSARHRGRIGTRIGIGIGTRITRHKRSYASIPSDDGDARVQNRRTQARHLHPGC